MIPPPLPSDSDHHLLVALMMELQGDGLYTERAIYLLNVAANEFDPRTVIALLAWRLSQQWDPERLDELWHLTQTTTAEDQHDFIP